MVLVHAHSLLEQKQLWLAQTSFQLDYGVADEVHVPCNPFLVAFGAIWMSVLGWCDESGA